MKNFLKLSYWIETLPGSPNLMFWRIILGVSVVAIVIGIIGIVGSRKNRKDGIRKRLYYKFTAWGLTVGALYLLLAFFRFQRAMFLSMRLWYLVWTLVAVVWAVFIIRYWLLLMPRKLKLRAEKNEFNKYLPSKN